MPDIAYLNGNYTPLEETYVSVNDRGYVFADGVYEYLRTYNGEPFVPTRHIKRLERSLAALEIALPESLGALEAIIRETMRRADYAESSVYIQVTRGTAPRGHAIPEGITPNLLVTVREFHPHADSCFTEGVTGMSLPDQRWGRCDIKTLCLLPNTLAKTKAHSAGAYEAILLAGDGTVREGSSSNLAIVRDGVLVTHPADNRILWGVTREIVLELARAEGIEVREEKFNLKELKTAAEVMLLGTTYEVMPVIRMDETQIADGKPGPVSQRLLEKLRACPTDV